MVCLLCRSSQSGTVTALDTYMGSILASGKSRNPSSWRGDYGKRCTNFGQAARACVSHTGFCRQKHFKSCKFRRLNETSAVCGIGRARTSVLWNIGALPRAAAAPSRVLPHVCHDRGRDRTPSLFSPVRRPPRAGVASLQRELLLRPGQCPASSVSESTPGHPPSARPPPGRPLGARPPFPFYY